MTIVAPFDGSPLAEAALRRATQFAAVRGERLVAVAVVPTNNAAYARRKGWIDPDEPFDRDAVVTTLRDQVHAVAPGAKFRHESVDRRAPPGAVSTRIRRVARREDASTVVVGSENAGRVVTAVASVGKGVAADRAYDVLIVRSAD